MKLAPEAFYARLGHLIAEMPSLKNPDDPDTVSWLARASALIEASGNIVDQANFNAGVNKLGSYYSSEGQSAIRFTLLKALARAELASPTASQGAFIAAGTPYDAFVEVGKVMARAKSDVLIVDPYADAKIFEFALQIPETVSLRILADMNAKKPTLQPARDRWISQYGPNRPTEVRLAPPRSLHDRLIQLDGSEVRTLGQSFNALAERSPTSILRVDAETTSLKIAAYEAIWAAATPL